MADRGARGRSSRPDSDGRRGAGADLRMRSMRSIGPRREGDGGRWSASSASGGLRQRLADRQNLGEKSDPERRDPPWPRLSRGSPKPLTDGPEADDDHAGSREALRPFDSAPLWRADVAAKPRRSATRKTATARKFYILIRISALPWVQF